MSIKHLKPRSKREVFKNRVIDFFKGSWLKQKSQWLMANEFNNVVPLSRPMGKLFYIDYKKQIIYTEDCEKTPEVFPLPYTLPKG